MTSSSRRLFDLVTDYATAAHHQTGSAHDHTTRAWFGKLLAEAGAADVRQHPYEFVAWEGEAEVEIDGRLVEPVLPLAYQGIGAVDTAEVFVGELETIGRWVAPSLPDTLAAARRSGCAVAVLATHGADGRLIALNRQPELLPGPLAILVPGGEALALRAGPVHVRASSRLTPATSATVLADFGAAGPPDLVVATPLTSWFGAAGERATGIAVTVAIAAQLAATGLRFQVVGTTGHELHHLGLKHHLSSGVAPAPVLHLGACVAAGTTIDGGSLGWGPGRRAFLTSDMGTDAVVAALATIGLDVAIDPDDWLGEGRDWRQHTDRAVSVLGTFPLFHTTEDAAARATSPDLLQQAAEVISLIATTLVRKCEGLPH